MLPKKNLTKKIRIITMRIINNRPFMRYIKQCKVKSSLEIKFIHPILKPRYGYRNEKNY